MKRILNSPYSLEVFFRYRPWILTGSTFFILVFFVIFQPFHFRYYPFSEKAIVIAAFGFICLSIFSINLWLIPALMPKWFERSSWKVRHELLWMAWNVLTIGAGFFLFKVFYGFYEFSLVRITHGILAAISIGIIAVAVYEASMLLVRRLFFQAAQTYTADSPISQIQLQAERGADQFLFNPNQTLFISSKQNYIEITYLENGVVKNRLLRNRMFYIESSLSDFPFIVRCHRAFMVHTKQIERFELKAHGGKIWLKHQENPIPISRKYVPILRQILIKTE